MTSGQKRLRARVTMVGAALLASAALAAVAPSVQAQQASADPSADSESVGTTAQPITNPGLWYGQSYYSPAEY